MHLGHPKYNYILQLIMPLSELKEILMQRIASILQLQALFQPIRQQDNPPSLPISAESQPSNKYDLILQHKKLERYRSLRESQLLLTLNNNRLSDSESQCELYCHVVEICAFYSPEFNRYKQYEEGTSIRQNIKQVFDEFFSLNGFKEKCLYINKLWEKDSSTVTSALFMGWLSEWSKKLYCQLLQKEIEKSFMNIKERSPKALPNGFTLGMFASKKKQNKCVIDNSFNELSDFALSTRTNIHSFMLDDLATLYKLTGIDQIDFTYLKAIRKRLGKEDLLQSSNLTKAVQTIIETSTNKQIQVGIKLYESSYNEKYRKKSKLKNDLKKEIIKPAPLISLPLSICPPLSPIRKRQKTTTESDEQMNIKQKVLSPKTSEIEFVKLQQINNNKKVKLISHQKSIRANLQFPGLILKKQTLKEDIKSLSNMLSPISGSSQAKSKKNESLASLQKRMKQGDFLRCQSISTKFKIKHDPYSFLEDVEKDMFRAPTLKQSKIIEKNAEFDYDDQRIKISRMFELADLRLRKINASSNRVILEQAQ